MNLINVQYTHLFWNVTVSNVPVYVTYTGTQVLSLQNKVQLCCTVPFTSGSYMFNVVAVGGLCMPTN